MHRKLYAFLILLGTLGALVLFYLYFFVYYTSTVIINANIEAYSVDFFSTSTAQTRTEMCPQQECIIEDVSPFEYNITIKKDGYVEEKIATKIAARKKQEFIVTLEKKARLEEVLDFTANETAKEKIQRLREESRYYAIFQLSDDTKLAFLEQGDNLQMQILGESEVKNISNFSKVSQDQISAEYISESSDIFLKIGKKYYIFEASESKIITLPYEIKISYIKSGNIDNNYLIVTDKGIFNYNARDNSSEFLYLFKDFVYLENDLVGIIYNDETEKKENFNLKEKGNIIMRYSPKEKARKVLLVTTLSIEKIEKRKEGIFFTSKGIEYELKNY